MELKSTYRSKKEWEVHILSTISNIKSSEDLRISSVITDIAGPEEAPQGHLGVRGGKRGYFGVGWVGLQGPAAGGLVAADAVEEVELEEDVLGHWGLGRGAYSSSPVSRRRPGCGSAGRT